MRVRPRERFSLRCLLTGVALLLPIAIAQADDLPMGKLARPRSARTSTAGNSAPAPTSDAPLFGPPPVAAGIATRAVTRRLVATAGPSACR